MIAKLASQAPSKEHHSPSDGQPAPVEPSPRYILKTSPRPDEPELDDVDEDEDVEAGRLEAEEAACVVELAMLEVVSGACDVAGTADTTTELELDGATAVRKVVDGIGAEYWGRAVFSAPTSEGDGGLYTLGSGAEDSTGAATTGEKVTLTTGGCAGPVAAPSHAPSWHPVPQ